MQKSIYSYIYKQSRPEISFLVYAKLEKWIISIYAFLTLMQSITIQVLNFFFKKKFRIQIVEN